jgi:hypothetical protein
MAVGCVVKQRSLRRADPSFRGVLSVVCVASSVVSATMILYSHDEYVEEVRLNTK